MNTASQRLEREYADALETHIAGGQETTLHHAYEIGRRALVEGLGVLDMAVIIQRALLTACGRARSREEIICTVVGLESFLLESLSPFEMAHRGVREANTALRSQNEVLEAETTRIAHELHDAAGQLLACAHLTLDQLLKEAPDTRARVREVRRHLDQVEDQIRQISHELRPTILDDLGLLPALQFLGESVSQRTGIAVTIDASLEDRLPRLFEVALYRIVQEALTNAVRHARASCVRIDYRAEAGWVRCAIRDNGAGMYGREPAGSHGNGIGLAGIRARVASLRGKLEIESTPAHGTELRVSIPLEVADAPAHPLGR